jgi:quinol monooxygenase YgiN
MTQDTTVSLHPYFKIHAGKIDAFKALCHRFVEKTKTEPGCLYYSFTFDNDLVYCREGYVDAAALLHHADNVGELIQEALTISDLARIEAHGPEAELNKLHERLAPMNAQYFVLYQGFRK